MKPFTLKVQDTESELVNTINNSELPAYVLKQILKDLYQQLEQIELDEIEAYKKEQSKEKPKKSS